MHGYLEKVFCPSQNLKAYDVTFVVQWKNIGLLFFTLPRLFKHVFLTPASRAFVLHGIFYIVGDQTTAESLLLR